MSLPATLVYERANVWLSTGCIALDRAAVQTLQLEFLKCDDGWWGAAFLEDLEASIVICNIWRVCSCSLIQSGWKTSYSDRDPWEIYGRSAELLTSSCFFKKGRTVAITFHSKDGSLLSCPWQIIRRWLILLFSHGLWEPVGACLPKEREEDPRTK